VTAAEALEEGIDMVEKIVRFVVSVTVKPEQLEAFKSVAAMLVEGSKAEPGTLGYEWFAGADGKSFSLLETYADAGAVEAHFAGPVFTEGVPKLIAACTVDRFEIFGDPGPKVTEIATGLGAVIYRYWLGQ
jgi:quinol monooxygenase YgiN